MPDQQGIPVDQTLRKLHKSYRDAFQTYAEEVHKTACLLEVLGDSEALARQREREIRALQWYRRTRLEYLAYLHKVDRDASLSDAA